MKDSSIELLLLNLLQRGLVLQNDGASLRFRGGKGSLSDDLKTQCIECKQELLDLIGLGTTVMLAPIQARRACLQDKIMGAKAPIVRPSYLVFPTDIDESRLVESIHQLVRKHEVLRSQFREIQGHFIHYIRPSLTVDIERRDAQFNPEMGLPWGLRHVPWDSKCLFNIVLAETIEKQPLCILEIHQAIADAISTVIVLNDLYDIYYEAARVRTSGSNTDFQTFAIEQHHYQTSADYEQDESYWLKQFEWDHVFVTPLKGGYREPLTATARKRFVLSETAREAVERLALSHNVTTNSVLLAAYCNLLHLVSGKNRIHVGLPVGNRNGMKNQQLVGNLSNEICFAATLTGNEPFSIFLKRCHSQNIECLEHSKYPIAHLKEQLGVALYNVMFNYFSPSKKLNSSLRLSSGSDRSSCTTGVNAHDGDARDLPRAGLIPMTGQWESDIDIMLAVLQEQEKFYLDYYFAMAVWSEAEISRLHSYYEDILFNASRADYSCKDLICNSQRAHGNEMAEVAMHPIALICQCLERNKDAYILIEDEKVLWAVLKHEVETTVRQLEAAGLKKGSFVGIIRSNLRDYLVLCYALCELDICYCELSFRNPQAHWHTMPETHRPKVVIGKAVYPITDFVLVSELSSLSLEAAEAAKGIGFGESAICRFFEDRVFTIPYHRLLHYVKDVLDFMSIPKSAGCVLDIRRLAMGQPWMMFMPLLSDVVFSINGQCLEFPSETRELFCVTSTSRLKQMCSENSRDDGEYEFHDYVVGELPSATRDLQNDSSCTYLEELYGLTCQPAVIDECFERAYKVRELSKRQEPGSATAELIWGVMDCDHSAVSGTKLGDGQYILRDDDDNYLRVDGFVLSRRRVLADLLGMNGVCDAFVDVRNDTNGAPVLFLWIAAADYFIEDEFRAWREDAWYLADIAVCKMMVDRIPLSKNGDVDVAALRALPFIDNHCASLFSDELKTEHGVDAPVILCTPFVKEKSIHLAQCVLEVSDPQSEKGKVRAKQTHSKELPSSLVEIPSIPVSDTVETLVDLLRKRVEDGTQNDILCLDSDFNAERLSYSELLRGARAVATTLRHEVDSNYVIILLEDPKQTILAFWSTLFAGRQPAIVAVPSDSDFESSAGKRLVAVSALLPNARILTHSSLRSRLIPYLGDPASFICIEDVLPGESDCDRPTAGPDDIALLSISSGSTGEPKIIPLTHRNLLSRARGAISISGLKSTDITLNWLPFDHIGSISDWHIRTMVCGCRSIYAQTHDILKAPWRWMELMSKYRATHSWAPNFAYQLIADNIAFGREIDLSTVRCLLSAGEPISADVSKVFCDALASFGLRADVIQPAFGMAETGSGIHYSPPGDIVTHTLKQREKFQEFVRSKSQESGAAFVDLGYGVPGLSMRIVDENNKVLPEDHIGLLQLRGEMVFTGYLHNEEENAKSFTTDGWFSTGDLAFISRRRLTITGRAKDTVIVNGANIYCQEIEEHLDRIQGVKPSYSAALNVRLAESNRDGFAVLFCPVSHDEYFLKTVVNMIVEITAKQFGISPDFVVPLTEDLVPKTSIGKIQRARLANMFESGRFETEIRRAETLMNTQKKIPACFHTIQWRARTIRKSREGCSVIVLREEAENTSVATWIRVIEESFEDTKVIYTTQSYLDEFKGLLRDATCETVIVDLRIYDQYKDIDTSRNALLDTAQCVSKNGSVHGKYAYYQVLPNVEGDDALDTFIAFASSLLQCLETEVAQVACRVIQFGLGSYDIGSRICDEISDAFDCFRVRWLGDHRYVKQYKSIARNENVSIRLRQGQTLVVFGGLGGIGVHICKLLLTKFDSKLIIVGRTDLNSGADVNDGRMSQLRELQNLGDVRYVRCDLADEARTKEALLGCIHDAGLRIDGILHLAGNWISKKIVALKSCDYEREIRVRLTPVHIAPDLLQSCDRPFFICFSSMAAEFGGYSMSGYSIGAGQLKPAIQALSREHGIASKVLAWTNWVETGMGVGAPRDFLESLGVHVLDVAQAIAAFQYAMMCPSHYVIIGLNETHPLVSYKISGQSTPKSRVVAFLKGDTDEMKQVQCTCRFGIRTSIDLITRTRIPVLQSGEVDAEQLLTTVSLGRQVSLGPRDGTERKLYRLWQQLLRHDDFSIMDSFFTLGGQSLLLAQLSSLISETFQDIEIPLSVLSSNPTIESMAKHIRKALLMRIDLELLESTIHEIRSSKCA